MSHILTVNDYPINDLCILEKAVNRLEDTTLKLHEEIEVPLFAGQKVMGVAQVNLPGWRYPVVVNKQGELAYDNYNGSWGEDRELGLLKQAYGVEKAKSLSRKQGYLVRETKAKSGAVVLELRR